MPIKVKVPATEGYDRSTNKFIYTKETTLTLEYSLISISKWESKWHIPFFDRKHERTPEMSVDILRCMTIKPDPDSVDPGVYYAIPAKEMERIQEYMNDKMTASWFSEKKTSKHSNEVTTAEIIYYYMITLGIPFECEKWHFNRLMALIAVCSEKNTPAKKMSKRDIFAQQREINEMRRKALHSKG